MRAVTVRVPASSANLGPGFDVLAAALELYLTVTVTSAERFSITTTGEPTRESADNLVVKGFQRLHPSEYVRFESHLEIPPTRGLGSSAAAFVAGLVAANEYARLGLSQSEIYDLAVELEGHPDNAASAVYGGVTIAGYVAANGSRTPPATLSAPTCVAPVLLIPREPVRTSRARQLIPQTFSVAEVISNINATARLVGGLERQDRSLIASGLRDSIHQERRADLFPSAIDILRRAGEFGALGATVSGAGPSVLLWCAPREADDVTVSLRTCCSGWATVSSLSFAEHGAELLVSTE